MEEEYKLRWQSPEYLHSEKSTDWYWVFGILGLALIVISVIMENYLFSVLLLISILAIALHSKKTPDVIDYEINKSGIIIGNTMHPYSSLKSFWVDMENANPPKLLLKTDKFFQPLTTINLFDVEPDEVSNYLAHFLPEEELHEPLSNHIMEYLGF